MKKEEYKEFLATLDPWDPRIAYFEIDELNEKIQILEKTIQDLNNNCKYYLLLAGKTYYPKKENGNWIGTFPSKEEAEAQVEHCKFSGLFSDFKIKDEYYDWYKVVDLKEWIVKETITCRRCNLEYLEDRVCSGSNFTLLCVKK